MDDDHIPLKDQFSKDLSDIQIDQKIDEPNFFNRSKAKPIKKKNKTFVWKLKWIKVPNAVKGSGHIVLRKWVKIKINRPIENDEEEENNEVHAGAENGEVSVKN